MKDDWVSAALADDTVVVELLFRLKQQQRHHHHHHPSSSSSHFCTMTAAVKCSELIGWGHRQRRSKLPSSSVKKAKACFSTTTTRYSPTTPLSWSGGGGAASPSDGGASSDLSSAFRSKGTFANEASNHSSSSSKRSKKRQTFIDLKEEENLLIKEGVHLKRELDLVHVTLNEQRVRSDNLKRIKFDLNRQSTNVIAAESVSNRCTNLQESSRNKVLSRHIMDDDLLSSTDNQNKSFVLPDLNMAPSEDEIGILWN